MKDTVLYPELKAAGQGFFKMKNKKNISCLVPIMLGYNGVMQENIFGSKQIY